MSTNRNASALPPNESVATRALSTLLRAELSACEAYRTAVHAIERGADCPALSLRCLYRSHRRAADELHSEIRRLQGRPIETAGATGVWSEVHERIASARGPADFPETLRALLRGERFSLELACRAVHGLGDSGSDGVRRRLVEGILANIGLIEALEKSLLATDDTPA
jgi:hypothetical protein